ncbi:hypothetical protein CR152_06625 [Massilia violaceinigra]|uniref:Uncharacterized protein n=1 Tax=Massilia violaceinigra TaxID=2045208 RepID=A0A2D2DGV6_9BURK|nr:hypothetical protein [Massilia violaceinigra]ATQ74210.1 hypothetical protein CR152_06625 [Massilia violaceinigra]
MTTITDFSAFLDQADVTDHEEAYALYTAVNQCTNMGSFECVETSNGNMIVSSHSVEDKLLLATPEAREAFLARISQRYIGDEDMDMEGWTSYMRGMQKDD